MRLTIPGNLLLTGEYAVTRPKGEGIAMGIAPSIIIDASPAQTMLISGTFEGITYQWKQGDPVPAKLSLLQTMLDHLPFTLPYNIQIDSSAFCHTNGKKKGFGSSAAVTVGLVYLFLALKKNAEPDPAEVLNTSLSIHRAFQRGRGSGYDIYASYYGGIGHFIGGHTPSWTPLKPHWKDHLYLIYGENPVSTKGALSRFESYLEKKPRKAYQFFRLSNRLTSELITSSDPHQTLRTFHRAAILNRWIHQQIDLDFGISIPCQKGSIVKPLGAGNELAALMSFNTEKYEPINISTEGLQCVI